MLFFALALSLLFGNAQTNFTPNVSFKWSPLGLFLGSASLQAEYNFGSKHSLTAKIGIPVNATYNDLTYDNNKANFNIKATSFLAGFRTYLSKKHMAGFYVEPFFEYLHHTSEGTGTGNIGTRIESFDFTNEYNGVGVGVQLGAQFFVGKHFVIDLFFLGPQINSAENDFKAKDITSTGPWSNSEAADAQIQVNNFINQFPIIRNNTTVVVDQNNRMVTAHFKGALPGIRTGISFGFAF